MQAFSTTYEAAQAANLYTYFLVNGDIVTMLRDIYSQAPLSIILDIQSQVYKDDLHVSITFFTGPTQTNDPTAFFNGLIFPLTGNLYTV
jgi:hypothetical protein